MIFEKKRQCGKYIFDISELFIQCNKDSCCKHITGGVNIYLYGCVSLLAPECAVCCVLKKEGVGNIGGLNKIMGG